VGEVRADTFILYHSLGGDDGTYSATFYVNIDKSSYSPGEEIAVEGITAPPVEAGCSNAGYLFEYDLMYGHDPISVSYWGEFSSGQASGNLTAPSTPGNYSVYFAGRVRDRRRSVDDGGHSQYTTYSIPYTVINPNVAPTITFSGPPSTDQNTNTGGFTMRGTDPEGNNLLYYINWGDGTAGWVTGWVGNGTTIYPTHTWTSSGAKGITVYAYDTGGLWSAPVSISIAVLPPPPASMSASCPIPGTTATLSWPAVAGATYYALRSDNQTTGGWTGTCSGGGDFCANVGATSYSFASIATHTYNNWVHACNSAGCSAAAASAVVTCQPPIPICLGTPSSATLCAGDNTGLTTDVTSTVVNSCTPTKCEYTCNSGFYNNAGTCILIPPPTVTTNPATSITTTSITLNGTANPNNFATSGWFRYSATNPGTCNNTFGVATPATSLGSGNTIIPFTQNITGLTAGTPYYYCALAQNTGGVGMGTVLNTTTTYLSPTVSLTIDGVGGTVNKFSPFNGAIAWTTTNNPTSCTASGNWSGLKAVGGASESLTNILGSVTPYTYSISCTNPAGTDTDSVTLNVLFQCTGAISANATICTNDGIGLSADTAKTLTTSCVANAIKCEYACDTGYMKVGSSCVPVPTLTAAPRMVDYGGNTTLTWNTNGADESTCTLSGGSLSPTSLTTIETYAGATAGTATSGTYSLPVYAATTYTLTCGAYIDTARVEVRSSGFET
jgi:hypothetical protein